VTAFVALGIGLAVAFAAAVTLVLARRRPSRAEVRALRAPAAKLPLPPAVPLSLEPPDRIRVSVRPLDAEPLLALLPAPRAPSSALAPVGLDDAADVDLELAARASERIARAK